MKTFQTVMEQRSVASQAETHELIPHLLVCLRPCASIFSEKKQALNCCHSFFVMFSFFPLKNQMVKRGGGNINLEKYVFT